MFGVSVASYHSLLHTALNKLYTFLGMARNPHTLQILLQNKFVANFKQWKTGGTKLIVAWTFNTCSMLKLQHSVRKSIITKVPTNLF